MTAPACNPATLVVGRFEQRSMHPQKSYPLHGWVVPADTISSWCSTQPLRDRLDVVSGAGDFDV